MLLEKQTRGKPAHRDSRRGDGCHRAEADRSRTSAEQSAFSRCAETQSNRLRRNGRKYEADIWSEEAARIYGYAPGTAPTPELILQRVHPDDVDLVKDALERAAQGGSDFDYEHRLLMPDGSIKHLHDLAHSFTDEAGNEEVVGAIMDITERKIAEEAIRRSEAYLAEAQRLSHTGSFGWKPETDEIVWSDETYRVFEYDRSVKPTIDSVVQRVHPTQDRAAYQKVIEGASQGATDFEHTYRLLLPDGRIKHVHAVAHVLQDACGNREFIGAVTDITEQRHAEAVIRKQAAELRDVVDTIPAIVWSALPDGSNSYVNSRFVEYCGMRPEEIRGTGWHAATHPDDLERHNAKWLASAATGEPFEDEVRFRRADGQYRWHLQRGIPLRDDAGNIVKWYGVLTDIEDRKRADDKIREHEIELRQILDFAPQLIVSSDPGLSPCTRTAPRLSIWASALTSGCVAGPTRRILTISAAKSACRAVAVDWLALRTGKAVARQGWKLPLVSRSVQSRARRQGPDLPLVYRLH